MYVETLEPAQTVGKNLKRHSHFGKKMWKFIKYLNISLQCNPAITFLSTYPSEMKTYVHTKICM